MFVCKGKNLRQEGVNSKDKHTINVICYIFYEPQNYNTCLRNKPNDFSLLEFKNYIVKNRRK